MKSLPEMAAECGSSELSDKPEKKCVCWEWVGGKSLYGRLLLLKREELMKESEHGLLCEFVNERYLMQICGQNNSSYNVIE